ncbi:MAG: peptide-methionine (S)-S-oxide reductase MsrA [Mangrovibacterium sp.]
MKRIITGLLWIGIVLQTFGQTKNKNMETVTLAGGCFWCTEAIFKELAGVKSVVSGYSGGHDKNPSYRDVCNGKTGHAEAVEIRFDPSLVSLQQILEVFFATHDPTTHNRQGNDVGTQYRSAIFYHTQQQKEIAETLVKSLNEENVYGKKVVTEIVLWENFYPAEDYHQNYLANNPSQGYCQFVIIPKMEKFRKIFKNRLKTNVH